jgi:predicted amidohydrolase
MRVGAAQFTSECGDVDANIEIHLDWIAPGRKEKLNLLVMPEMSLSGHSGSDNLLLAAITCSDPRLIRLAEEAGDMTVGAVA